MKKIILIAGLLVFVSNVWAKEMFCGVNSIDYSQTEEIVMSFQEVLDEVEISCEKGDLLVYRNSSQLVFTSLRNVASSVCDKNKPIDIIKETVNVFEVETEMESLLCTFNGSIREER